MNTLGVLLLNWILVSVSPTTLAASSSDTSKAHDLSRMVMIVVEGDSLEVTLVDPRQRRDHWPREQRDRLIPNCTRSEGNFAYEPEYPDRFHATRFVLDPAPPGLFRLQVRTLGARRHVAVEILRPLLPLRCARVDTLTMEARSKQEWTINWSIGGRCWTELKRRDP